VPDNAAEYVSTVRYTGCRSHDPVVLTKYEDSFCASLFRINNKDAKHPINNCRRPRFYKKTYEILIS
jgi:hypothetical protein